MKCHRADGPPPVRVLLEALVGEADVDTTGLELAGLIRLTANLYDEAAIVQHPRAGGISGPRWMLLGRLLAEEARGNREGLSPTHLSRWQKVSKNTVSALLRGLEEQGLIERAVDPADRRGFRIRLTDAGRELVRSTAPQHLAYLNSLVEDLTSEERAQLLALLGKLCRSLAARLPRPCPPPAQETVHNRSEGR